MECKLTDDNGWPFILHMETEQAVQKHTDLMRELALINQRLARTKAYVESMNALLVFNGAEPVSLAEEAR